MGETKNTRKGGGAMPAIAGRIAAPSPQIDGGGGALGNITKSICASKKPAAPSKTYKIRGRGPDDGKKRRTGRYRMSKQAGTTLGRNHRVAMCQRLPTYGARQPGGSMGISLSAEGSASFHGVGSCGDVWCCPICALRIAEGRRAEVLEALRQHRAAAGIAILVTFTFSHQRGEQLEQNIRALAAALGKLKALRSYKTLLEQVRYRGQIRALEVMHGNANGWHPHVHEIWFLDQSDISRAALQRLQDSIFELWRGVCVKAGLGEPNRENGVVIDYQKNSGMNDAVGAYVAKWGFELTHLQGKRGKNGSRSPWAILQDLTEQWTYRDSELFKEYAAAIKGRAQLFWSRGLKKHFSIDDVTDARIADRPEKIMVRELQRAEWNAIVYFEAHAWVLDIAEAKPLFLDDMLQRLVALKERRCSTDKRRRWELKKEIEQYVKKAHPEFFVEA